jgi:hypothetical protein
LKKLLGVCILVALLLLVLLNDFFLSQKVNFKVLKVKQLPFEFQNEISANPQRNGFYTYTDKDYTYVFYRANHKENEYITTDLSASKKQGEYTVNSIINRATNDNLVSQQGAIRIENVSEQDLVLREQDLR